MNVEQGFGNDRAPWTPAETRRRRLPWIAGAAIILVALAAWALFGLARPKPGAPAGGIAAGGAPGKGGARQHVTVVVPGHQPVMNMVPATGSLAARRDSPVGAVGEGGLVSRVLVEPGSWVRRGQVLAVIERSVQAEQSAQMAAAITARRADARIAQSELDRSAALVGRGFISRADLERKTAVRDSAIAQVRVAQAQLGEMRARVGRLDIRAPASGLVLTRAVEAGQVVSPGSGALFRIAEDGALEMLARVSEQDLATLRVGAPATVTPVGGRNTFAGSIWQISPVIDPTTRQGIARIALRYDQRLRPGGFASAAIGAGGVDAPLLPESAVLSDQAGNYVYVVGPGEVVERRAVRTGPVSEKGVAILNGLQGNERVVQSAGAFLNPGDVVIPERQAAR